MRESRPKRSGVGATRVKLVQTGGGPCKKSQEHKQTNDFLDIELGVSAEPMISQGQKQRMVVYFSPNLQHSLRLQSARYIAHLLPKFPGTIVQIHQFGAPYQSFLSISVKNSPKCSTRLATSPKGIREWGKTVILVRKFRKSYYGLQKEL